MTRLTVNGVKIQIVDGKVLCPVKPLQAALQGSVDLMTLVYSPDLDWSIAAALAKEWSGTLGLSDKPTPRLDKDAIA